MAVASSEIATGLLELRSAALTLIAVLPKSADLELLDVQLTERAAVMPGLFDGEPVAIDLSCLRDADVALDVPALIALLRRHRMVPVAARCGSAAQMAAAVAAGLAEAPDGARPVREPLPERIVERVVEVQLAPLPPLIVERPLRSGQQVYARDRDLIVLALVSHGAEVIADGHIHVYAPLRGRALAGAKGDVSARIFTSAMEAQLLAVAGVYRTTELPLPKDLVGRAAMVRLADGELMVEALNGRP